MRTNTKVYVLLAHDGLIKVGSSSDPERRLKELRVNGRIAYQTNVISESEVVERRAHRVLALTAQHVRGEWFVATVDQAIGAIKDAQRQVVRSELPLGGELIKWRYNKPQKPLRGGKNVVIKMSDETRRKLDDVRAGEGSPPSMAEMIRLLIDRAHEALPDNVTCFRVKRSGK